MGSTYSNWPEYCRGHKLKKAPDAYCLAYGEDRHFRFAHKDEIARDKTLDEEKSRTYVLLGDYYVYVGITATLKTRVTDHKRSKPFDNVLWLECPNVYFSPVDVSMMEKGIYAVFEKSQREGVFEAYKDEVDSDEPACAKSVVVGNGGKPKLDASAPNTIHYKNDKWLLDSLEGFFLYLAERGYRLSPYDEYEVLSAMRSEEVDRSIRGRLKRLFDKGTQVENSLNSLETCRRWRRCLSVVCVAEIAVILWLVKCLLSLL